MAASGISADALFPLRQRQEAARVIQEIEELEDQITEVNIQARKFLFSRSPPIS